MFQSVLRRLRDAQAAELEGGGAAEAGFTLIELMVVLLIIAILLAIAIPTFLGVTGSANDRAAQSNLTNALTEAAAVYQGNNQTFAGIATILPSSAPEFSWVASNVAPSAGTNQISVATVDVAVGGTVASPTNDSQGVILAALSKNSNTCWWAVQLDATPVNLTNTDTNGQAFETAASGSTGGQTGASKPGTYYAKSTTATVCKATYPTSRTGGFTWGTSYANAPVNS
jgi:prepilin-type N-terminal cleavage/methylation domain-containing protein